jgi:hypothetical protein
MARRRSYLRDMAPSEEELRAAKTSASAAQDGSTWGSAIGTGLGALGGGILGTAVVPGLGTAAGAGIGAGIGGGLGSAIGGAVGGAQADEADKIVREGEEERQKTVDDEQMYQDALDRFLRTG